MGAIKQPGGWQVERKADGTQVRFRTHASEGTVWVHANGVTSAVPNSSGGGAKKKNRAAGGETLEATVPCKVTQIIAKNGDRVEMHQPLLLVEAMKMEFSIKAPSKGIVKKIRVAVGDVIAPGTLFVEFEAQS